MSQPVKRKGPDAPQHALARPLKVDLRWDPAVLSLPLTPEIKDLLVNRVNAMSSFTLAARVEAGRALIRLKEGLGHGEFIKTVEAETQVSLRQAEEWMILARKLGDGQLEAILRLPAGKVRLLLRDLTDEDIKALDAGGGVRALGGATLDDVAQMSRAELVEELGRAKGKIAKGAQQLRDRDDRIEQLTAALGRRPKDQLHPFEAAFLAAYEAIADLGHSAAEVSDKALLNDVCGGERAKWTRMLATLDRCFKAAWARLAVRLAGPKGKSVPAWQPQPADDRIDSPDLDL